MNDMEEISKIKSWKDYIKSKHANMSVLSSNPNIHLSDYLENSELKWDYDELCLNENIPIEFIMKNSSKFHSGIFKRIPFSQLSSSRLKNNYWSLSCNKTVPFSYVLKFKKKHWDWETVINVILTEYDYQNYPNECDKIFSVREHIRSFHRCNNLSVIFIF